MKRIGRRGGKPAQSFGRSVARSLGRGKEIAELRFGHRPPPFAGTRTFVGSSGAPTRGADATLAGVATTRT